MNTKDWPKWVKWCVVVIVVISSPVLVPLFLVGVLLGGLLGNAYDMLFGEPSKKPSRRIVR